jgi:four helix bundle protein
VNTRNVIVEKSFAFALKLIEYCEKLDEQRKFVIARQLLRCGTAIGANVYEAQEAESKADFIHKMKIAAKEAREAQYWLMLCSKCSMYPKEPLLEQSVIEIIKILGKIITSSRRTS